MSASPNPNQVMSTLRMLGDQELGQYAKMHKSDPYIFPLAFQESMMRKQMRSQGAAQPQGPGGAPPPPVNEQALASMQQLPESSGIARIAPPGVATMAAGGIVGFAGGGTPEAPIEETIMRQREEIQQGLRSDFSPEIKAAMRNRPMSLDPGVIPGATGRGNRPTMANDPRLLGPTSPNETTGFDAERARNMALVYGDTPAAPAQPSAPAVPAVPPVAQQPRAGLGALGMGSGTSMSLSQSGGAAGAGAPGIPRMDIGARPADFDAEAAYDARMAKPTVDPQGAQRQALVDEEAKAARTQLEGRQGISAEQSKLYDKQEGRLAGRQENIEKEGKRNEAMSWITAGLEMMQAKGPGLAAIASGAQKGFSQYGAGLEKLKDAQERLDAAKDGVDANRLGAKKELLSAQSEYDRELAKGKREMLSGIERAYGVKAGEAQQLVKMQQEKTLKGQELYNQGAISNNNNATAMAAAQLQSSTQLRAAEIQAAAWRAGANRNPQLEMFVAMGGGDPVKGAQAYFGAQQGKSDPLGVIAKYRESLPDMSTTKGGLSKSSPPEQIMAAMMADLAAYSRVQGPRPAPMQNASGAAAVRP